MSAICPCNKRVIPPGFSLLCAWQIKIIRLVAFAIGHEGAKITSEILARCFIDTALAIEQEGAKITSEVLARCFIGTAR